MHGEGCCHERYRFLMAYDEGGPFLALAKRSMSGLMPLPTTPKTCVAPM